MHRFHLADASFAKKKARILRGILRSIGRSLPLTECLSVVSRLYGYRDHSELVLATKRKMDRPSPTATGPLDDEIRIVSSLLDLDRRSTVLVLNALAVRSIGSGTIPAADAERIRFVSVIDRFLRSDAETIMIWPIQDESSCALAAAMAGHLKPLGSGSTTSNLPA